jgi:type IV pilus assembly protein PilM
MAALKSVWGIEVGSYAIKALRLDRSGDEVRVGDFAVIPHRKVLTTPDLQVDEMIRIGLGQLISEKDVRNQPVVMSVPGHLAFARFAKLPPVEPKKIPDIVRFEAVQQIPFPIEDVEWDYQTFGGGDLPELEVGIFAITKERLAHLMGLYGELGIQPQMVNLSPVALFNAVQHDLDLENRPGPLVLLDIGTTASDLIVAEQGRAWVRTFPLGGTHFTEAIAESFKVPYAKAEKLKLEASSSKYARQIMQAMRPVFGDLLGDVSTSSDGSRCPEPRERTSRPRRSTWAPSTAWRCRDSAWAPSTSISPRSRCCDSRSGPARVAGSPLPPASSSRRAA